MATNRLISISNIKKTYFLGEKKVEALKGVSLDINEGDFISIMGVSGSGKSTLLYILGLMDTMTDGEYFFMGQNVRDLPLEDLAGIRNSHIGFVFQQFHLIDYLSALENVLLPLIYSKKEVKEPYLHGKVLMDKLGLSNYYNNKPSELSGGEQQRVAVARALVNEPKIILADEPTGQLDLNTSKDLMNIFCDLNNEGKTIVLVTHDPDMAKYSKKIINIKDGMFIN
ncbi:MAG: ABC transporter ATP-binding protein [Deferribacterota bacterium]|nr:ABC transporter ATP-binding protein [Deferribacterota bacterium]